MIKAYINGALKFKHINTNERMVGYDNALQNVLDFIKILEKGTA